MVFETLVFSPLKHLTRLMAREKFIILSNRESNKSHYKYGTYRARFVKGGYRCHKYATYQPKEPWVYSNAAVLGRPELWSATDSDSRWSSWYPEPDYAVWLQFPHSQPSPEESPEKEYRQPLRYHKRSTSAFQGWGGETKISLISTSKQNCRKY